MSDHVIEVQGLRVSLAFSGAPVVRDFDISVRRGEALALVGESGSGKTTAALALLGFTRPGLRIDAGRVMIDGIDVLKLPIGDLRRFRGGRISFVPQNPAAALNPALRITDQFRDMLRAHGKPSKDERFVTELFDRVSLPTDRGFLSRFPHELSGGQQQRVLIAMSLACRPSVVVLDEPTTGLDVTTQATVLELVKELRSSLGVALLYVSHDLAVEPV